MHRTDIDPRVLLGVELIAAPPPAPREDAGQSPSKSADAPLVSSSMGMAARGGGGSIKQLRCEGRGHCFGLGSRSVEINSNCLQPSYSVSESRLQSKWRQTETECSDLLRVYVVLDRCGIMAQTPQAL